MTAANNLTNITLAEAADSASWDDLGGGQGSGQDANLPIQGAETRSRRVDNVTRGFGFDAATAPSGIGNSGTHVGFWVNVLQPGAVTSILFCMSESTLGAKSGTWSGWSYVGSNYPKVGGWQRVWVDFQRTRDDGAGTLTQANVLNFGAEFVMGDVGGTTNNCHLDRMDFGTEGITITGGTVPSPSNLAEAVTLDDANALGIIFNNTLNGKLRIGGAATVFFDENFALLAGSQPLAAATGWIAIEIVNDTAGMDISFGGYFMEGIPFIVTGTSSSIDLGSGTLLSAPAMSWNSSVTFAGKLVACGTLTWGQAQISNTAIEKTTDASALLINTATDPSTYTTGMSFVGVSEHGMELGANCPASITLTNISHSGYNTTVGSNPTPSSGPTDAFIYNNSGKAITITLSGTANVSVRNGASSTTVVVAASFTLTLTGIPSGVNVTIVNSSTRAELQHSTSTGADITYGHSGGETVDILLMGLNYDPNVSDIFNLTLANADQSIPFNPIDDPNYDNP